VRELLIAHGAQAGAQLVEIERGVRIERYVLHLGLLTIEFPFSGRTRRQYTVAVPARRLDSRD